MTEGAGVDERHLVGLETTCPLKVWRHPIAGVLTECDRWVQARPFFHHLEQCCLFGTVIFEAKTAPGEGVQDVLDGSRGQIDAVVPRRNSPRSLSQLFELFGSSVDLVGKLLRLPHKTGVGRFHGFICLIVNPPVAVKTTARAAVPMTKGIGKPGTAAAGSIKAPKI